jgi:polyhydroxyalkanoate synthase
MREGPHPLSVYLGLAAANAKGVQDFVMQGAAGYSQKQLTDMVRGIQKYQSIDHYQAHLKTQTLWQHGTVRILRPDEEYHVKVNSRSTPLLLIPSLINKAYIFDLAEERSFLRWMNNNGVTTYLLDWGDLVAERKENASLSIAQLLRYKMCKAIDVLADRHDAPIDVLGYCMGGTLLAGGLHIARKSVRKAVFLASPWDFHADRADGDALQDNNAVHSDEQGLAEMVRNWAPIVLPIIESKGCLPKENTQSLFAALGARSAVHKFIKFVSMDNNASGTKLFVSAEDWLNDGVDLPCRIARECIKDWFLDNAPARGLWYVDDYRVNPASFDFPSLVIAARKDSLVPFYNARALYEQIPDNYRHMIVPNIGHVGLIVGRNAVEEVWRPLRQWLCE